MTAVPADGRTARRNRNLDAVLDAALELFAEGMLEPGAADVADRSGVSLRSVYRYFDDTEALLRAAITRKHEQLRPLFEIEGLDRGPLGDRVQRLVAGRVRLYEATAPMIRASLRRAPSNEIVRTQLEKDRRALRRQVDATFAGELADRPERDRDEVLAAVDVLVSFGTLEHLRLSTGCSPEDTVRTVTRAVMAVLAVAPVPTV
jgi:AcrR family transcriptional regulator